MSMMSGMSWCFAMAWSRSISSSVRTLPVGLVDRSREIGAYFKGRLERIEGEHIQEVRGKGLLIGVELTRLARPYCDALRDEGILAKDTHGTVVRFAPPLVITKEQIDWAIERIEPILMNGH